VVEVVVVVDRAGAVVEADRVGSVAGAIVIDGGVLVLMALGEDVTEVDSGVMAAVVAGTSDRLKPLHALATTTAAPMATTECAGRGRTPTAFLDTPGDGTPEAVPVRVEGTPVRSQPSVPIGSM
jgi:hypothetical protein